MSAWLKAGLIGAVILIVLNLIGLIPLVGCITFFLGWLAYIVIGVMAGAFMSPPRTAGAAAGQGALAALLASVVSGIVSTIVTIARMALFDSAEVLSQIPPEALEQLRAAGVDPGLFAGIGGGVIVGSLCCVVGIFIALILGAIGGAIYAAIAPQ